MTGTRLDEADALREAAGIVMARPNWADLDDRASHDAITVEATRLLAEQEDEQ